MPYFLRLVARILDRIPSTWGIPLLVVFGAMTWLGIIKLFGL